MPKPGTGQFEFLWTVPATIGGTASLGKPAKIMVTQYNGDNIDVTDAAFCIGACQSLIDAKASLSKAISPLVISGGKNGAMTVKLNQGGIYNIRLIDTRGKIAAEKIVAGNSEQKFSWLAAGMYLVSVKSTSTKVSQRVMIMK
jgi:hypothetical protein